LSGAVVVLIERFIPSRGVMPRESGASSNPCVIRGFDAYTQSKSGGYWIARFRGR